MQLRFVTLRHVTFTLCCFTLRSNIVVDRLNLFIKKLAGQHYFEVYIVHPGDFITCHSIFKLYQRPSVPPDDPVPVGICHSIFKLYQRSSVYLQMTPSMSASVIQYLYCTSGHPYLQMTPSRSASARWNISRHTCSLSITIFTYTTF